MTDVVGVRSKSSTDSIIKREEGGWGWRRKPGETVEETEYNREYVLALKCITAQTAQLVWGLGGEWRHEMTACEVRPGFDTNRGF